MTRSWNSSTADWQSWPDLLRAAYRHAAAYSVDPSTQNAAVLVRTAPDRPDGGVALPGTWAANGLPRGVADLPERWDRPLKYAVVEHAERNAIYTAARQGVAVDGLAMVCPWAACTDCARAIIQAGVSLVVTHAAMNAHTPTSWADSIALAQQMMTEAGVVLLDVTEPLNATPIRHTGQLIQP